MKRSILTGLTIGFMAVATAPAFALSVRFEDARQQTLNKLNQPVSELNQQALNALNDRFKEDHEHTVNKLSDRFKQEREQTLNK